MDAGNDYINHFDPEAYLKTFYSDAELTVDNSTEGDMKMREMQFLHEAFTVNNIKGRRLLDIGTGPTVHSVISASSHVDSIFLSDFAPQNIDVLRRWLDGTLQHSFQSFFKSVVDFEGKRESPTDREKSVKEKVSGICSIDLLQEYPLAPSFFPKFDVITSSLCLEVVPESLVEYEKIARRVSDMLQDGGHLVSFGVLGEKFYKVGNHVFGCLDIDGGTLQAVWKRCGFRIVSWEQRSNSITENKNVSDFVGYFMLVAKKDLCLL